MAYLPIIYKYLPDLCQMWANIPGPMGPFECRTCLLKNKRLPKFMLINSQFGSKSYIFLISLRLCSHLYN